MTKHDLICKVTEDTGLSKEQVKVTIEDTFKVIGSFLEKGNNVYLRGFGTFQLKRQGPKVGRNFDGMGPVKIPSRTVVKLIPGKHLSNGIQSVQPPVWKY